MLLRVFTSFQFNYKNLRAKATYPEDLFRPVVQRLEFRTPNPAIRVRFSAGLPIKIFKKFSFGRIFFWLCREKIGYRFGV